jgi:hypothetical protein
MGTNILTTDSLPDVDTSGYIPPDVGERYGPIIEKADGFAQVSVLPAPLSDAAGHSFGEPVHYSCVCALSFGGNINAGALGYSSNCLHHDLHVLTNPVQPPSTPSSRTGWSNSTESYPVFGQAPRVETRPSEPY